MVLTPPCGLLHGHRTKTVTNIRPSGRRDYPMDREALVFKAVGLTLFVVGCLVTAWKAWSG